MTPVKDDYDVKEKIKINFKNMPYYIMPRYKFHYIDNEYEKFSLQILKNNLNEKKTFLDIGAHYGAYSLYAANSAKSKVIAIEPVNENFQILNDNVKINNLEKQIKTYNYAISDKNGDAEFNIPWASDSAGFYDHPNAATIKKQKVQTIRIDDLVKRTKVDFIKIDTEGHEISVLKGMAQTLKQNPEARLIIELNPECLKRAGKSALELLEVIDAYDKEIYMVDEDEFTLIRLSGRLHAWEKYIKKSGYANLYCVPKASNQSFILYVSHNYQLDGAERAMVDQIEALNEESVLAHVIVPNEGLLRNLLIEKGISHNVVAGYHFWSSPGKKTGHSNTVPPSGESLLAALQIKDIAKTINPTAILNNTIVNPWGYIAAKLLGLPLIWYVHEFGDLDHGMQFPYDIKAIRKFLVNESSLVLTCSEAVKKILIENSDNVSHKKINTIYNFLDFENIINSSKFKIKSPFSNNKNVIKLCMVGVISESKGQILAIEAINILKQRGINAELLIIGSGEASYIKKLKRLTLELDIESQIAFLGYKDNPYPYIREAEAVLVCSKSEAFGRTIAEAMLLNTLVIGSNAGGVPELVEPNETGLLFTAGDVKDLAFQIEKIKNVNKSKIVEAASDKVHKVLNKEEIKKVLLSLLSQVGIDSEQAEYGKIINCEWAAAVGLKEKEILENQENILTIEEKLQAIKTENEELKLHNKELKLRNSEVQKEYNSLINSKSWIITKPLRYSSFLLKRIKP